MQELQLCHKHDILMERDGVGQKFCKKCETEDEKVVSVLQMSFNPRRLRDVLLNSDRKPWMARVEIVDSARSDTCLVRFGTKRGTWFLRHSKGPVQGHFWDMYGDDYKNPEWALLALSQAPPPPNALDWKSFSADQDE